MSIMTPSENMFGDPFFDILTFSPTLSPHRGHWFMVSSEELKFSFDDPLFPARQLATEAHDCLAIRKLKPYAPIGPAENLDDSSRTFVEFPVYGLDRGSESEAASWALIHWLIPEQVELLFDDSSFDLAEHLRDRTRAIPIRE